jgi:glycosyltransferase involved in cell wall biosynthesis
MFCHACDGDGAVDWTFYCELSAPGALDNKVTQLGARIVRSPVAIGQTFKFIQALRKEIRNGGYDVIHCHHDVISALYLVATIGLRKPQRIVHVHNADEAVRTSSRWKGPLLRGLFRRICLGLADKIVGISNHTLDTFLNGRKRRPGRDVVHYYGIDPEPFRNCQVEPEAFRRELGLADDARILLFAGRLVPEKNPQFVLDVLNELRNFEPRAVGIFVGSGSETVALKNRVLELTLEESVRFLGWRDNVPEIMKCSDLFILPRPEEPMEGFGIAVVEAQLAGLRLLLSQGIPDDPLLTGSSSQRLSLAEPAEKWARAAYSLLKDKPLGSNEAAKKLAESSMDMDRALTNLLQLYRE